MDKSLPISLILLLFLLSYCKDTNRQQVRDNTLEKKYKKSLLSANRKLVENDINTIKKYAQKNKWNLKVTGNGLFYEIVQQGEGKNVEKGDLIYLNYTLKLLNGTHCYSSDSLGLKVFEIGRREVERGLEEGIKMLKEGAKARFVLPPFLGHGLIGDNNKIPPLSTIVYEIELVTVETIELDMF